MTQADAQMELNHVPSVGVHRDVPDGAYHQWDAVSKSRLWLLKDLLDVCYDADTLKAAIEKGRPDSDALAFGRAIDDFLFYPDIAKHRYKVSEAKTRGTAKFEAEQAAARPFVLLLPDEAPRVETMVESLRENPLSRALLSGRGSNQLSIAWDDSRTGLRCKARIDRLTSFIDPNNPDAGEQTTHVDLKTARDLDRFNYDALDYGYYLQAAHYKDGCEVLDELRGDARRNRRFLFLVVEKKPHGIRKDRHRVNVFEYDDHQIDSTLRMRDVLLSKWKRLYVNGEYPGDTRVVRHLWIPEHIENAYGDMESD